MKKVLQNAFKSATCIDDVESILLPLLISQKTSCALNRLGFVSGSLFSEGPEFVERNMKRLVDHTEQLRSTNTYPLFSAFDVFYCGLADQLEEYKGPMEARRPRLITFWRNVITSGHITDIFMTPGWDLSEGAQDEHTNAKKMGLKIHYITRV